MSHARVPAGKILNIEDIVHEEQYQQRNMFEKVSLSNEEVVVPAMLPVLSKTQGKTLWAGPELGEHTEDILKSELQLSDEKIASLREKRVI